MAAEPTVICEGKTDNIYLRRAILSLAASFPTLASVTDNKPKLNIRIFRYPQTSTGRIMGLTGGTGSFLGFIPAYANELHRFSSPGMQQPVVFLMDNDDGASKVLAMLNKQFKKDIVGDKPFIHACGNLYIVTTPLSAGKKTSVIEDCFTEKTKGVTIEGKTFKADKAHGDNDSFYAKYIFAKYVESHSDKIDFSGFSELLSRIAAVVEAHKSTFLVPDAEQEPIITA